MSLKVEEVHPEASIACMEAKTSHKGLVRTLLRTIDQAHDVGRKLHDINESVINIVMPGITVDAMLKLKTGFMQ